MAVIGKITLYEHWDAAKLQQKIDNGDTLYLEVERRYTLGALPENLTAVLPAQFGTDYMGTLIKTIDASTFVHEQDCIVWIVKTSVGGTIYFDMSGSYKRTGINSAADTEAVANDTVLLAEFTTPGLPESVRTAVTLPYAELISDADLTALSDAGITMTPGSKGSDFVITSKTPFSVRFFQPSASAENYVIEFDRLGQIITL